MYQNGEWSAADEAMMRLDIGGREYSDVSCKEFVQMIEAIRFEWQVTDA